MLKITKNISHRTDLCVIYLIWRKVYVHCGLTQYHIGLDLERGDLFSYEQRDICAYSIFMFVFIFVFAFACLFVLWLFIVSRVRTGLGRGDLRTAWWKGVRIVLWCSAGWGHGKSVNNSNIQLFAFEKLAQIARIKGLNLA